MYFPRKNIQKQSVIWCVVINGVEEVTDRINQRPRTCRKTKYHVPIVVLAFEAHQIEAARNVGVAVVAANRTQAGKNQPRRRQVTTKMDGYQMLCMRLQYMAEPCATALSHVLSVASEGSSCR